MLVVVRFCVYESASEPYIKENNKMNAKKQQFCAL